MNGLIYLVELICIHKRDADRFGKAGLQTDDQTVTVVQIEKPEDAKLADWFAELRLWFDHNDCNPILFSEAGRVMNNSLFNIRFADEVQANLFVSAFARYRPTIPFAK